MTINCDDYDYDDMTIEICKLMQNEQIISPAELGEHFKTDDMIPWKEIEPRVNKLEEEKKIHHDGVNLIWRSTLCL